MKLKPFVMENLGEEEDVNLDDILKDICTKFDEEEKLSEIETIVGNYILFINEVVDTFERLTGYSFYEKTEKELDVEEKDKKSKSKKDLEIN